MRKIKELLRLKFEQNLSNVRIAKSLKIGETTVERWLTKARKANVSWPLDNDMDNEQLNNLLYPLNARRKDAPLPNFSYMCRELKKKGVTLTGLWEEYTRSSSNLEKICEKCVGKISIYCINLFCMSKLTLNEKAELESQLKKTRDVTERNRLCIVLGYNDGISIEWLAKTLRISPATIYNYLKDFENKRKTKSDSRGGSEPKLSEEQSLKLSKHLDEVTYLKVKGIIAYVKAQYGICYSRSGMTAWLKAYNFVFKRPKKVPGKLDPEKQETFISDYEKLKASLGPNEEIYFADAVHPEHQSQATCGWIKKGVQKTLQSTGKQLRLHFAGAISLNEMKVFSKEYETVDADAMIDFLKGLEQSTSASTIHVILDNARSNKNKKLEAFLTESRIKVHYLPPYSPNLNPIERLWKIMKEIKVHNKYYQSSIDFFHEIRLFFSEEIPKSVKSWRARITDKFQAIRINPIQPAF